MPDLHELEDNDERGSVLRTPVSPQETKTMLNSENYDDSVEPKKTRPVSELYNETEEVELDEVLYLMGVDEPWNFNEAVKDENWKRAMS